VHVDGVEHEAQDDLHGGQDDQRLRLLDARQGEDGNADGDEGRADGRAHVEEVVFEGPPGHPGCATIEVAAHDPESQDVRDGSQDTIWQAVLLELVFERFVVGVSNGDVVGSGEGLARAENEEENRSREAPGVSERHLGMERREAVVGILSSSSVVGNNEWREYLAASACGMGRKPSYP